ncbi:MAG: PEP-CTERM sorting domain-containing protein [Nitrosomonas sp.]|nr:PEP-CTERM sorting domain-containing protein [Nitrosomonas sp.]
MKKIVLCLFASAFWISTAHAELIVKIEDLSSGTTHTYTDSTASSSRQVSTRLLLPNFSIIFSATSTNLFGTANTGPSVSPYPFYPSLGFSSRVHSLGEAVDLRISITDTDYGLPSWLFSPNFVALATPVNVNTNHIESDYYFNLSNIAFDTNGASVIKYNSDDGLQNIFSNIVEILPLGFGQNFQPFSLTQIINIHVDPGLSLNSDIGSRVMPEPGVLFLIGLGVAGLMLSRARRSY